MASKKPTYGKDLPGNLGTDEVLRAIYDKISDSSSSVVIEEQLNVILNLLIIVNNNIEINTQTIKDISINVDIHYKDLMSITDAINKQTEAIKQLQPKPLPRPLPPPLPPPPHPQPLPPRPHPRPHNYIDNMLTTNYCYHEYRDNNQDFHNPRIWSNPNLTNSLKAYLDEVYRGERQFNQQEYNNLPHFVPMCGRGFVDAKYDESIYWYWE